MNGSRLFQINWSMNKHKSYSGACFWVRSSKAAGEFVFHHRLPWSGGAQLPYHGLHPGLQGNLCSAAWRPSLLPVALLQMCFTYSHSSFQVHVVLHSNFFQYLYRLIQGHYHHHWWTCPPLAVGPSWGQMALDLSDTGETSGIFSQNSLMWSLHYQNLAA